MIFSSNQKLEISGDLKQENDLKSALKYALKKSGWHEIFSRKEKPSKCCFQITQQGEFCIGWAYDEVKEGWTEFQFDYDLDIISKIITNHLNKQDYVFYNGDGSNSKGYIINNIEWNMEEIKNNFYGIVIVSPYTCYYAK